MKSSTVILALGLAVLGADVVIAGDFNNGAGGIKDHGGLAGIPVPAPIPVAESFSWYLRADLGMAVRSTGNSVVWRSFDGTTDTLAYNNNEGPFHGSVGFGRYVTPSLRWDLMVDFRGDQKGQSGTSYRIGSTTTPGANGTTDYNMYDITRSEEVRYQNHTGLLNLYYDFNRGGGLNPYLGIGAGAAVRMTKVQFNEHGHCFQTDNFNPTAVAPTPVWTTGPCGQPDYDKTGKPRTINYGPVIAGMAGFTYEFKQGILLDTGYRAMWQSGQSSANLFGGDKVTGEARLDHEIRAGMRWNVW